MGTLYERIQALCKSKGVSGSRMCLDLGMSKSTLSDMKNGRTKGLSMPNAQKIASYFGISVDELYGNESKKETPQDNLERKQNRNVIKIAGRDGSFKERVLTDEQLAALAVLIDQLPDVPDDL